MLTITMNVIATGAIDADNESFRRFTPYRLAAHTDHLTNLLVVILLLYRESDPRTKRLVGMQMVRIQFDRKEYSER